jgi:hypothetical protein
LTLMKTQIEFLSDRSRSPITQPSHMPKWMHDLWKASLIDVIGDSIYITDTGFRALAEDGGAEG